jgi:branched-chain amino acid transport system ATP-binding protein
VRGVSLRFGGIRALTEVSFGVNDGELFSIIGPNGAGKTSIVNCISGRYRPTEGRLIYGDKDITGLNPNARATLGIGRTFQNLALFHHLSVLDNIMVGRHHLLKNNFITGSICSRCARLPRARFHTGCASALSSRARWRWSPG